ncbi:hypothetical protein EN795_37730, partial [bacterium M00.F.Ca.ET.152.01.1.1]
MDRYSFIAMDFHHLLLAGLPAHSCSDPIKQMSYWHLTDSGHTDDVPTTVRRVRELLDDTIQRQLIADVP